MVAHHLGISSDFIQTIMHFSRCLIWNPHAYSVLESMIFVPKLDRGNVFLLYYFNFPCLPTERVVQISSSCVTYGRLTISHRKGKCSPSPPSCLALRTHCTLPQTALWQQLVGRQLLPLSAACPALSTASL